MANKTLPKVLSKWPKVGDRQNPGIALPIGRNHPDALAVDRFAVEMKVKLARKRAEELADVIHCSVLVAITAGIEIEPAVIAKFNSTGEKNGLRTLLAITEGSAE